MHDPQFIDFVAALQVGDHGKRPFPIFRGLEILNPGVYLDLRSWFPASIQPECVEPLENRVSAVSFQEVHEGPHGHGIIKILYVKFKKVK